MMLDCDGSLAGVLLATHVSDIQDVATQAVHPVLDELERAELPMLRPAIVSTTDPVAGLLVFPRILLALAKS
eukprot:2792972-Rhodomonas_salina.2